MRALILLASLLVPSAAVAAAPAPAPAPASANLWIDWTELSRRAAAAQVRPSAPAVGETEARALGDRVGRMVAAGDCRGGEKVAMAAGDSRLVEAVRNYCRS
jgi:hypothetical protein